jgi:hypothetical protein
VKIGTISTHADSPFATRAGAPPGSWTFSSLAERGFGILLSCLRPAGAPSTL